VSDKERKKWPDAETSLIFISPRFSMTMGFDSCSCHPEPCPELDSGLFRDLGFGFRELRF
jgi:hypothetical protein